MPKELIKRYLPDDDFFKRHKQLRWLGKLMHDGNLWHLNRRCVAKAIGVGLFCAFMPIPFQMALACAAAIIASANLPIAVALVWVSNPLTMAPIFYGSYKIGRWVLHSPQIEFHELTIDAISNSLHDLWLPILCGTVILGLIFGVMGYFASHLFWRYAVVRKWRNRSRSRL